MAKHSIHTEVGKRRFELSNLTKVLYPDDGIIKAEVVEYYLKIAPTLLTHTKNRALSLVRYPDGIYGEQFFQKQKQSWAPDWIQSAPLGSTDEKKDYILATEPATIVWLANLACLELHQMHSHKPHFDKPDYFVFDLDPPEGFDFDLLMEIAHDLHDHIDGYGYHPFVKTSGKKGLHIFVPISPKWDFHTVFEASQDIAKPFVESHKKLTTLNIKKDARKGRVLVDIYRNRTYQSIISAYSLRGSAGAPVSMPLAWEDLQPGLKPADFNISNVVDHVSMNGDAWEGLPAFASDLHTKRSKSTKVKRDLGKGDKYKTPEQLESYGKKRDFKKTAEPVGVQELGGDGDAFVVHRHHASRLHYDLRIEQDGVLKSWAVPRGMPPRPGIKRLAVATEDHPMKYLTFEGDIPKKEYGGGTMWIYALGKYEITKEKKDGFYFTLNSRELNAEYRIYNTKEKEWLLERLDEPQINWVGSSIEPMLAKIEKEPPTSEEYAYEVKWDGIRAMIYIDEGEITIKSRNQRNITHLFPELNIPEKAFRATSAVFDSEIVCLDPDGRPHFKQVISRLMHSSEGAIERASKKRPANCYVFDCLYLDGRALVNEPLMRRREWMTDAIRKDTPYRVSETVEDGEALFNAAKDLKLEGIMAKEKDSKYYPGKRSTAWLKIKVRQTVDCVILGYTKGEGDRAKWFGALHIAEYDGQDIQYRGKVGTGFNTKLFQEIKKQLDQLSHVDKPIKTKLPDDATSSWVEARLICEIQYASITNNETFREPVFIRMRPDLEK